MAILPPADRLPELVELAPDVANAADPDEVLEVCFEDVV